MSIDVQGVPIMSQGEFIALARGFPRDYIGSGVLQGLWAGESLHPATVHAAFNVELRLAAQAPEAEEIIDKVLTRLEEAFPDEGLRGRPGPSEEPA